MHLNRKNIILISIIAVLALLLGGAYIWYSSNYGNMKKLTVENLSTLDYEYKSIASTNGLTGDYIWSRTKELMLVGASDGTLIPSNLTIEGRLVSEPQEESGEYKLSDQALLLLSYVRRSDRFAATNLVNRVSEEYDFSTQNNYENSSWLEALIEYYSAFGKSSDYDKITALVDIIFEEDGSLKKETISVSSYNSSDYVSTADEVTGDGHSSLDSFEDEGSYYTFDGVIISSINLSLIRTLENNALLPEGSFERNLEIVLNSRVSESIKLYAYAYEILDDGTYSYINSHNVPAAVDVSESILTMRNLSEVNALPQDVYLWLKSTFFNNPTLYDTYYFVTGAISGNEAVDSYVDVLNIAINMDDSDLFSRAIGNISSRVATYNNSPALSMIYRSRDDRYVFFARENLEIELMLL